MKRGDVILPTEPMRSTDKWRLVASFLGGGLISMFDADGHISPPHNYDEWFVFLAKFMAACFLMWNSHRVPTGEHRGAMRIAGGGLR